MDTIGILYYQLLLAQHLSQQGARIFGTGSVVFFYVLENSSASNLVYAHSHPADSRSLSDLRDGHLAMPPAASFIVCFRAERRI